MNQDDSIQYKPPFKQRGESAFVKGAIDRVQQFDYDAVEPPTNEESQSALAAEVLGKFLDWVYYGDGNRLKNPKIAFGRFIAATSLIRPELLDNKPFDKIAEEIGCTKQNVSRHAVSIQRALGLKFRRSSFRASW